MKPLYSREINPSRKACGFSVADVVDSQLDIPTNQKLVFRYLARRAGENGYCYPGQKRMAKDLGISERQIRNIIAKLKKRGLIGVRKSATHRTNEYFFLEHPIFSEKLNAMQGNSAARPKSANASLATSRYTAEQIEQARVELERSRRMARNGYERPGRFAPPDHEITTKILENFNTWEEFTAWLIQLVRTTETSEIRSYGFYLSQAGAHRASRDA
jgi:DNA-binding MarR family transcriptional regulator